LIRLFSHNAQLSKETIYTYRGDQFYVSADVTSRSVLKNTVYVPIFLIAIVCGTLMCCVIVIFIVRRFATDEMLDGNPTLTIVLILANMFTLLTTLPFCMTDDYFGAENLNARKILLTTLAFGLTFSIMLSRALFLALSSGDVFIAHINGYLQSLMTFFMCGVQIAMSIMYFVLNTTESAVIARSPIFLALLGTSSNNFHKYELRFKYHNFAYKCIIYARKLYMVQFIFFCFTNHIFFHKFP